MSAGAGGANGCSGGHLPLSLPDARRVLDAVGAYGLACVHSGAGIEGASERAYTTFHEIVKLVHGAYEDSPKARQAFAEIESAYVGDVP